MKGINVIGHVNGNFGLGKALRLNIKALEQTNIPFKVYDYKTIAKSNMNELAYECNLFQISLHEVNEVVHSVPFDFFQNKYNLLYLVWESEIVPEKYHSTINLFDEIWTASGYCKSIFSKFFLGEITVVPHPIEVITRNEFNKNELSIYNEEKFSFLFVFDFNSSALRKNPYFLIEVFKKASKLVNHQIELVLKTSNSHHHKKDYQRLMELIEDSENIKIIDEYIDRKELEKLIQECDCYISLHHAEGFGLTLAEAMAYGKPVIATNYSGNTEFMTSSNSFLVETIVKTNDIIDNHFDQSTIWGNPLQENSVNCIVEVFSNPQLAFQKGKIAKQDIAKHLSYENVGRIIENRFHFIYDNMEYFEGFKCKINYFRNQYSNSLIELRINQRELKKIKKNVLVRVILYLKMKYKKFSGSISSNFKILHN
ncbi:glycosyltransferase family 4 protein [Zunongwangia pacifica]|uniref:Glycosyltransferase family 4 protein n=1 Tax=Zunongwangia pacifica TaxID=2911062 RepID=A0A9X1ZW17_9FLAO|nr:glycosyltransferase family 4 protein [Zunongwangia pacifica]MCL6220974.1 glycosyltransferase family 4 protein [Zunongwangia pacifica]